MSEEKEVLYKLLKGWEDALPADLVPVVRDFVDIDRARITISQNRRNAVIGSRDDITLIITDAEDVAGSGRCHWELMQQRGCDAIATLLQEG